MEPKTMEVASRVRALREDLGLTMQEMAEATGRSVVEYAAQEAGQQDLSFTFLYRCAEKFGVDVVDLLTGESPRLASYSLVRNGEGLSVKRYAGFEYLHKAPNFRDKQCEPFVVTIPFDEEEAAKPMDEIHLSKHEGQELDFILSGRLRFVYDGKHVEELGPGDTLLYDSGKGHGLVAIGGEPCVLLAAVMKPQDGKIL